MFINKENLEKYKDENIEALDFNQEKFNCCDLKCEHCAFADNERAVCMEECCSFDEKLDILLGESINLEEKNEREKDI